MAYRRDWPLLDSDGLFTELPRFEQTPHVGGLVGVGFAGGGGSSLGLKWAGLDIDFAMNHDAAAIAMHMANCPEAVHYCQDIWQVHPATVRPGEAIRFMWFSPDCTHFSKAKGGTPVEKKIRDLAWVIVLWAKLRRPDVICMENVEEFVTWGPLMEDPRNPGQLIPDPARKGEYFEQFKTEFRKLGYYYDFCQIKAFHMGTPTIRKRLFGQFRCDGQPIAWPSASHEAPAHPAVRSGQLLPWRTIAECIDWTRKCPSIFLTTAEARAEGCKRPLVDNTMARITLGLQRYVLEAEDPYYVDRAGCVVPITHSGAPRAYGTSEPIVTQTCAHRGEHALIVPSIVNTRNGEREGQEPRTREIREPYSTLTAHGSQGGLVAAHLTKFHADNAGAPMTEPGPTMTANSYQKRPGGAAPVGVIETFLTGCGGRRGQSPPISTESPFPTSTRKPDEVLVAVYMAQHNGGVVGHDAREPLSTLMTAGCHQHVTAAHLAHLRGAGERFGNTVDGPGPTDTAGGQHLGISAACLVKYYGTQQDPRLDGPSHTDTTRDRFALVMVDMTTVDLTEEQRYTAYWVARMIDVYGHPEGLPPKGRRRPKNWGSLVHRSLCAQIDRELTPRPSAVGRPGLIVWDVGMRMLSVRERYRAQGVPDDFIIDVEVDGKPITATQQGEMCGNMVCPQVAEAIARAALPELREPAMAEAA